MVHAKHEQVEAEHVEAEETVGGTEGSDMPMVPGTLFDYLQAARIAERRERADASTEPAGSVDAPAESAEVAVVEATGDASPADLSPGDVSPGDDGEGRLDEDGSSNGLHSGLDLAADPAPSASRSEFDVISDSPGR